MHLRQKETKDFQFSNKTSISFGSHIYTCKLNVISIVHILYEKALST
jgi:hypothetical protein